MKMRLVVDLCGTLVRENTTHAFLRDLELSGARRWLRSMLLSPLGLAVGNILSARVHRMSLVACLRGIPMSRLREAARHYATRSLETEGRRIVVEAVRERPEDCILASASLDVIVGAFAEHLSIPVWLGSTLGVQANGSCAGRITLDTTGRKLRLLEELVGESLSGFRLFTDNREDADLMGAAAKTEFLGRDFV